jgi:gas vesicle protein
MSDDKGASFFGGLIIGGLLGLTAGLLLAPRSGQETREVVGQKMKDAFQQLDHVIREQRDAIEIAIAEGKETAEKTALEVRNVLTEVIEKTKAEQPE